MKFPEPVRPLVIWSILQASVRIVGGAPVFQLDQYCSHFARQKKLEEQKFVVDIQQIVPED